MSAQILAFPRPKLGAGQCEVEHHRHRSRVTFPHWTEVQVEARAARMVALLGAARAEIAQLEPIA